MPEAIVIVTRLMKDQLEVLVSRPLGPEMSFPTALLQAGEHPCEGALRALDAALGSDACQAFRKLTTTPAHRHYFQASPELADDTLPAGSTWTRVAEARAALSQDDARVLAALD